MAGSALEEWYTTVDAAHLDAVRALRRTISASLPAGFEEAMSYGMPSWVVPHSRYPGGYHVNPDVPLPFVSLGSQKRHIGLYHMGLLLAFGVTNAKLAGYILTGYPRAM